MDKLQKARGPTTIWTANLESPCLLAIQQGASIILSQNCSSLFNMFYSAVAASNLLPNSSQLFPLLRIDNAMPMPEADVYTLGNAYEKRRGS